MNDRAFRIVLLQALTYMTMASWFLGGWFINHFFPVFENYQAHYFVATIIMSLSILLIWRKYVRWTGLRTTCTAALTALMITQVLIWKPVWGAGTCVVEDCVRNGQAIGIPGVWCAACCGLWWAGLLIGKKTIQMRKAMSRDAVRLALGGSLIPFLPGLILFSFGTISLFQFLNDDKSRIWLSLEIAFLTGVVVWLVIWKHEVDWSRQTIFWTVILSAVFIASAGCVFVPTDSTYWGSQAVSEFVSSIVQATPFLAASIWFGGSAYVWRSKPFAVAEFPIVETARPEVSCPECSYNLTGLREVRCPECGWASTVDDIVSRSLSEQLALSGGSV
jgi:hypothetical protein